MRLKVAALLLSLAPTGVNATQPERSDSEFSSWAKQRIAALAVLSSDRSTPERTLQSFFRFMNDREEVSCVRTEVLRRALESFPSYGEVDRLADKVRDQFFLGLPISYYHVFDEQSFATCMDSRNSYGYEVIGVEPIGQTKSRVTVRVRNTTPLKSNMKPDAYDLERRADGYLFRFDLLRQADDWKITQISEKTEYGDGWNEQFTERYLEPLVPSLVMFNTL